MTDKRAKQPIEVLLDQVYWKEVQAAEPEPGQESIPYVTHEGVLKLGDIEFRVAQLSDGTRVINAEDLSNWFKVNS